MTRQSRAEYYRSLGIEAEQRAAKATEPKIKVAFEDVANGWFELAEQMDWRERQHDRAERNNTKE